MPTRKITRAYRRTHGGRSPVVTEFASLIDFLNAMQQHDVPFLPVSYQIGREILGQGLSGGIRQATADISTVLAFKQGVPSKCERDDDHEQDWYSLVTEIAVLQHPPIRNNHHIIDILGVAFYVGSADDSSRRAWPLLVSLRANLGDLSTVLNGKQRFEGLLSTELRSQLFTEVVEAVYLLHASGVAHGDIKPSNFLVEKQDDQINCLLTDFGSCVIRGQDRMPTSSPPWNGPELAHATQNLGFDELSQADLFSLGLVCVHILLPLDSLLDGGVCFLRQQQSDDDWIEFIYTMEQAKQTDTGPESLASLLISVISQASVPEEQKLLLESVVRNTIVVPSGSRKMPWNDIFQVMKDHVSTRLSTSPIDPAQPPPLAYSTMFRSHDGHISFNLSQLLGELDDTDYVIRQNIVRDMQYKAYSSTCSECRKDYAFHLAVCHEIGFGCVRNGDTKLKWLEKSGKLRPDFDDAINQIGGNYEGTNRVSSCVLEALGIGVLLSSDRVLEYQTSGRISEAEASLKNEIKSRSDVFGTTHRCLARLEGELAQVFRQQNRDIEAAECQQRVVNILSQQYGSDHPSSVIARLTLASIWTDQGLLRKAEALQQENLPLLREVIGNRHPDVLLAMHQQANTKSEGGDYREAEKILREVISHQNKMLGPEHPMTINSELSLVSVLKARGHHTIASDLMDSIEDKLKSLIEGDGVREANLCMIQASLYADMGSLDKAMQKAKDAQAAIHTLRLEDDNELSLTEREVRAHVHHVRREWAAEEALLRQILITVGSSSQKSRKIKTSLASNLLWLGHDEEAYAAAEEVIQSLGQSPLSVAPMTYISCVNILAEVLSQGQADASEEKLSQLIQSCLVEYGEDHPITLQSAEGLAQCWNSRHNYAQTQRLLAPILERLRHQRPGKTAIHIAQLLARAYCERGDFGAAVDLCEEALHWARETVGERHMETLALHNILATVYLQSDQLAKADKLLVRIDSQCTDTKLAITIKSNLRMLRQRQGQHEEALKLSIEAQNLVWSRPGPVDSEKLAVDGSVLQDRVLIEGLHRNLEEEILENIRQRGKIDGARHPARIAMMADLAYAYAISERLQDTGQLFKQIEDLGGLDEDQEPIQCAILLGKMAEGHFSQRNFDRAEALERRALAIRQRLYPSDHNSVLKTKSNLASTLTALGRYSEAEAYLREVLAARESHAPNDASTLSKIAEAQANLAAVLYFQNKFSECVLLYSVAQEARERAGASPNIILHLKIQLEMAERRMMQVSSTGVEVTDVDKAESR